MKINPFLPNSPVHSGMFTGRLEQLEKMEQCLLQTKASRPKSFMLCGERGIGKTSLMQYFKSVAEGYIPVGVGPDRPILKFLVLDLDIEASSTESGLIERIQLALDRELSETEKGRTFIRNTWSFLSRMEAGGVKLASAEKQSSEGIRDQFAYSLAETTKRITATDESKRFSAKYDGVLLLIDEADRASTDLGLGAFLKTLLERVQRHGCLNLCVGLAGLPELQNALSASHESVLRSLENITVGPLTPLECTSVIDGAISEGNKLNPGRSMTIDDEARTMLTTFSEGFPHFIQQFGASSFEVDSDWRISTQDILHGAIGENGAISLIGDRYYRSDFYEKIKNDSYRRVLMIMAKSGNGWVTKSTIRSEFKGTSQTLDNAIQALRTRRIILSKEGEIGTYRLQSRAFALWISLQQMTTSQQLEAHENASEQPAK